jgi:hypothetical protein
MTNMSVTETLGNPDARWLTIAEAARTIVLSELVVRRLVRTSGLTGVRVFGRVAVRARLHVRKALLAAPT